VLFREVNERIEAVNRAIDGTGEADFICECGDDTCTRPISLTLAEYEEVRSNPTHFAVAHGHVEIDVESLIAHFAGYSVVEKGDGAAEQIALQTDPRS
jgi:hypothetical protein